MASPEAVGLLGGIGQGMADVGKLMAQNQMETLRMERMAEIQGVRDEKLFGQKKEMADIQHEQTKEIQTDKNLESQLDRDVKTSEGQLDRESAERIANIRAQASKDAAAAKGGSNKPSNSWKKYQELRTEFTRMNPGKPMPKDVETALLNAAYGTDERINTQSGEVVFTGLLGEGKPGVTAEYARPEGGSRRDREFRTVAPPEQAPAATQAPDSAAPDPAKYAQVKGDYSKYEDGAYNGGQVIVRNGVAYKLK